jgi:hypothetical protein
VRVAIADADPVLLHAAVRGVAQVERHRQRTVPLDVADGRPVGAPERFDFGAVAM